MRTRLSQPRYVKKRRAPPDPNPLRHVGGRPQFLCGPVHGNAKGEERRCSYERTAVEDEESLEHLATAQQTLYTAAAGTHPPSVVVT